jgi:hypothetical protein
MSKRGSIYAAVLLILLGILFFIPNLTPGFSWNGLWPAIFLVLAAGFFLPVFIWPRFRKGLAGMFIPGSVLLMLGTIFFYDVITRDWSSWAYSWILLITGSGMGLALASWYGRWSKAVMTTGIWIMIISMVLFSFFAALFGNITLRVTAPVLIILVGGFMLWQALRRPKPSSTDLPSQGKE